jgi:CHAT domain-containing protein
LEVFINLDAEQKTDERQKVLSDAENKIFRVLEWLWDSIAEPVLDKLKFNSMPTDEHPLPRVWWCPTGLLSFLPIHASGYHDGQYRTVMDRVISAYTSTVRALRHSRANGAPPEQHKVFIVAMPNTPQIPSVRQKLPPLRLAKDEAFGVRLIWRQVPNVASVIVRKQATKRQIIDDLPTQTVVHLVCHADADEMDPSSSALMVEDGPITVAQISELNIRSGALVYLSACRTALSRATALSDEVITLTTAFQIAGFSRIVGALWNASDRVAFRVSTKFYQVMGGDVEKAAEALHIAVSEQRQKYRERPSIWASYIYVGA